MVFDSPAAAADQTPRLFLCLLATSNGRSLARAQDTPSPRETSMSWSVEGTYIEACNCEVACPCVFLSPPTEGDCKVVIGWHIETGRHGDTVLDGLNAAMIAFAPEHMMKGHWKVALYLD